MENNYKQTTNFIDIYTFVNGLHNYRVKAGITKDVLHTLYYIKYSEREVTPKMLATYFKVSKPRITNLISPLLDKEYVMSKPSSIDGRSYCLILTKKGESFLQYAMEELFHLHHSLLETLGEEDYQQLVKFIKKANKLFE